MSEIKDGGPAFPCSARREEKYMDGAGYGRVRVVTVQEGGMTLRDYFAAKALIGELSSQDSQFFVRDSGMPACAKRCYAIADAMLAAREAK